MEKTQIQKGKYGPFWSLLFIRGFQNCPEVRARIETESYGLKGCPSAIDKLALRRVFNVDSLTRVGPDQVREIFESEAAQRMIAQAERKAEEKEAKSCLI